MTPPRRQDCQAEITIGGATYQCGRLKGHDKDPMAEEPDMHQCEGHEHPVDGETYFMAWISPRRVVHTREEPASDE